MATIVRRYKQLVKDRSKSGRPRSCRTKNNIKVVQERVRRDIKCSMRKMARDFKMDQKSMRTIVKTDLKLSPLKLKKCQHFTILQQRNRALWSSLEFVEIWHPEGWNCFFRQKIFTLKAMFNQQNDRVLVWHSEDVPEDMLTVQYRQNPASVMVWAALLKT